MNTFLSSSIASNQIQQNTLNHEPMHKNHQEIEKKYLTVIFEKNGKIIERMIEIMNPEDVPKEAWE